MSIIAYDIVRKFEQVISDYAGSKYGVAVSSCTNALFLCCAYLKVKWVHIPKRTYPGVAFSVMHAGGKICWTDEAWSGIYRLRPYPVYDSALRFQKNMYIKESYYCLSFHSKKHIPIGRGGMILTDSKEAVEWFKQARFDGRHECPLTEDDIIIPGWNMYMMPEQAARGLMLFDTLKNTMDLIEDPPYPDLSKMKVFNYKNFV